MRQSREVCLPLATYLPADLRVHRAPLYRPEDSDLHHDLTPQPDRFAMGREAQCCGGHVNARLSAVSITTPSPQAADRST